MAQGIHNQVRPHTALNYRPTCSPGYYSVDSNLGSGTINGGRSDKLDSPDNELPY